MKRDGFHSETMTEADFRADQADIPEHLRREMAEALRSRRDFLKAGGLASMALIAAGCTAKRREVVPPAVKPEHIVPGVAYWYASTCSGCAAACGVLYKVRDGRPIKAEGSLEHPLSRGGLCAKGQAVVLSLYDSDRLRGPLLDGREAAWDAIDRVVGDGLKATGQGDVVLLTGTINGPANRAVISEFLASHPGAKHVAYDAVSCRAIREAHRRSHGKAALPHYNFGRADVIVSFGADFLGTWISPVEFARDWAGRRSPQGAAPMSRHIQLEARLSLTGANADERHILADSERGPTLARLAVALARRTGVAVPLVLSDMKGDESSLAAIADELWAAHGRCLVISDSADVGEQTLLNLINETLGNYGATLDVAAPSNQKLGDESDIVSLLDDMRSGKVKALVCWGVNPVYDALDGEAFAAALAHVPLTVAIADRADETARLCRIVAPDHHPLETWNDSEAVAGLFSLSQPMIRPLYDTRAAQTSLLRWAGSPKSERPWRHILRDHWKTNVLGGASWAKVLEAGFHDTRRRDAPRLPFDMTALTSPDVARAAARKPAAEGFELVLHESIALGDGRHANNSWLQELPDPLTKISWGNVVALAPAAMRALGLKDGDTARVSIEVDARRVALRVPALAQPGMSERAAALALGYGRTHAGRLARGASHARDAGAIGANAFPFLSAGSSARATVSRVGGSEKLARPQIHDSLEGRADIARETTLAAWLKNPRAGNSSAAPTEHESMWPPVPKGKHHFGMVIDLNACMGCAGCVVGCQAENNIPVVGREEMARQREMHWLRIDRYYSDDKPTDQNAVADNPSVTFQPMMCQHCEHAPCETVCPVAATVHSEDGLNQQVYNRCVGTRYCANNCPYKTRRFNWFDYKRDDPTLNLVLNPDVTIRSRGVMEKCSLCAQRLYEAKLQAAKEGRAPREEELTTACQRSCPTSAIIVGDLNDPQSRVSKLAADPRNYAVLAELNVKPGITYLTKVRNRGGAETGEMKSGH